MFTAIKKLVESFRFAGRGILSLIASERSMRIHAAAALAVVAAGIHFSITKTEWCLVALCIGMVMAAEAFNTAVETLTDLAKPEFHPLAGKIKDISAGGVLLTALAAAATGLLIFWKYLFPA